MVKNYNCEKCGKKFNQKSHYTAHQNRKSPCVIESKVIETIEKIVNNKINDIIDKKLIIEKVKEVKEIETIEKIVNDKINDIIDKKLIIEKVKEPIIFSKEKKVKKIKSNIKPVIESILQNNNNNNKLTVLDLFCGCGGMSKGLTDAGLDIIAGIDIWDKAIDNYKKNYHHKAICTDLTKLPPELFCNTHKVNQNSIDIIVGGPPCFIAGTKILTNSEYKNIEDVLLEDELLTHTGKFQKIVNLQSKIYSGDLYELDIKYHPEIIFCTEEHPFFVREKKRIWDNSISEYKIIFEEPMWKKAKELTKNDYFGMVINSNKIIPEINNIKLDKKEYWYMLGYFVSNKYIIDSKKSKDFMPSDNFLNILLQIKNNQIPEWVQDAPTEFIQEFINGYLKADKDITKNNKIIEITTLSYNLAYGLQRLFLKLGHIFSINKCIHSKIDTYIIREVLIKDINILSFIENNYVWYAPLKITKKNTVGTRVYNFEVSTDNSYIVMNTIVHNCQTFSMAGRRPTNDPRNSLFMEFVKYLNYFNPKAFIMENVIGILSKKTENNEKVIDIIMTQLTKNYNCIICKLYASDFEVPQNRRRVIIIGIRIDLNIIPVEPKVILEVEKRIPVKKILLQKNEIDKSYYLSNVAIEGIKNKKLKSIANGNGFGAQYLDLEKPSFTIPARYHKDGYDALVKYSDTEIRRLTILELKRIQTFPDNYILDGSKKDVITQIGNAVACRFAFHLGKHIIKLLSGN